LHILPKDFTRIRHYGILSGTWKKKHLKELQKQLLGGEKQYKSKEKSKHKRCRYSKKRTLSTIHVYPKNKPPPSDLIAQIIGFLPISRYKKFSLAVQKAFGISRKGSILGKSELEMGNRSNFWIKHVEMYLI